MRAHDIDDFDQLVIVVVTLEEGVHFKHEASHSAADCPHVQRVIVLFVLHKKLGALVVPARDTHIVLLLRLVEICEAPVDKTQVAVFVVDHDVEWLHISVHDAMQVRVLKCLKDHVGVEADIYVRESSRQHLSLNVWNVFEDESGSFRGRITQDVVQLDNVWTTIPSLQDLYLAVLLLDSHRLQDFNDTLLVVRDICSLKDLGVLSSAKLMIDIVVIELGPVQVQTFIVAKAIRPLIAYELKGSLEDLVLNALRLC